MAENQSKKSAEQKTAEPRSAKPANLSHGIEGAFKNFVSVINDVLNESREMAQEAVKDYYATIANIQSESQRIREEEHRHFLGSLQESFGKEDVHTKLMQAQRTYGANLEEKQAFLNKGVEEANQDFTKHFQEASVNVKGKLETAYSEFLTATQQQLADAQMNSLKPKELAKIGQILQLAGQYAHSFYEQQPVKN